MQLQEELFRSIYTRYMPIVRIIARKFQISENDIDDVVQDVFIGFYKSYGIDKPEDENRRLLARIANNCCIDYKRRLKSHPEFSCDPVVIQEEMCTEAFFSHDSLTILMKKQEYQMVADALKSMKKEWAEVFRLHVIEDRPMAEVSRILGVSEAACKMRLHRGREYLKAYMEKEKAAEEDRKEITEEGSASDDQESKKPEEQKTSESWDAVPE